MSIFEFNNTITLHKTISESGDSVFSRDSVMMNSEISSFRNDLLKDLKMHSWHELVNFKFDDVRPEKSMIMDNICPDNRCNRLHNRLYKKCITCGLSLVRLGDGNITGTDYRIKRQRTSKFEIADHFTVFDEDRKVNAYIGDVNGTESIPAQYVDRTSLSSFTEIGSTTSPFLVMLDPDDHNPNSHVNIDHILLKVAKDLRLAGVKDIVPERYDLDIHCDVGAMNRQSLDDAQSPLHNISVWMGGFHMEKNYGLILPFRILMSLGLEPLAAMHGFSSPHQFSLLCEYCSKFEKSKNFIRLLRDVLETSLILEIAIASGFQNDCEKLTPKLISDYIDECKSEDKNFNNLVISLEILSSTEILFCAPSNNKIDYQYLAVRYLLPWGFAHNSSHYSPVAIREMAIFYHQMSYEASENRRQKFTHKGKSHDRRMEEYNQKQKLAHGLGRLITPESISRSALEICSTKPIRHAALKSLSIPIPKDYSSHSNLNLREERDAMVLQLLRWGTWKFVSGRSTMHSIDMTKEVPHGADIASAHQYGLTEMRSRLPKYLNSPYVCKFPAGIKSKTAEKI